MLDQIIAQKTKQYGVTLPLEALKPQTQSEMNWAKAKEEINRMERSPGKALGSLIDYWITMVGKLKMRQGHEDLLRNISDLKYHGILTKIGNQTKILGPYQIEGYSFELNIAEKNGSIHSAWYSLFGEKAYVREIEGSAWQK